MSMTNPRTDQLYRRVRLAGWLMIALDIVVVVVDTVEAPPEQRGRVATEGVGGLAGAAAGGWLGGKIGAAGGFVGALLLGTFGAVAGGLGGRRLAAREYDAAVNSPEAPGAVADSADGLTEVPYPDALLDEPADDGTPTHVG